MFRTANLIIAVLMSILAAAITGCGGSAPTSDLPFVSDIPSENWATSDGYGLYVCILLPASDGPYISRQLKRDTDGCLHGFTDYKYDAWIVRDATEVSPAPAGGIEGLVKFWDITMRMMAPEPVDKTSCWRTLPPGAYRLMGKLTSTDVVEPYETLIVGERED